MRYTWVSVFSKSKFLALPNYWIMLFTSSPPRSTIPYMHIPLLPDLAMVKKRENDLWINLFLVKLQDHTSMLNPLSASVALIETSQLICTANQLTVFYMQATLALNGLKGAFQGFWSWNPEHFLTFLFLSNCRDEEQ